MLGEGSIVFSPIFIINPKSLVGQSQALYMTDQLTKLK